MDFRERIRLAVLRGRGLIQQCEEGQDPSPSGFSLLVDLKWYREHCSPPYLDPVDSPEVITALDRCIEALGHLLSLYDAATKPPANLEVVLYLLLPQADCNALVGDLEQRYRNLEKRLGKLNADIWYTKQVVTSVWPLLRAAVRRVGGSAVVGVLGVMLRMVGMGSVADGLKRPLKSEPKARRKRSE